MSELQTATLALEYLKNFYLSDINPQLREEAIIILLYYFKSRNSEILRQ